MNGARKLWRALTCAVLLFAVAAALPAQTQKSVVPSRVTEAVDDTQLVKLTGNVHPLARTAYDQGALADSQPMSRMMLVLQRSGTQEQTLQQLLDAQQTKSSGSYHAWLTPEQFGQQFGPSDADVQAVTDWLTKQGFQVANVAKGKTVIEFNGNVAQVRNAFHTEIHRFVVNGEEHFANVSDPSIPAALAPVVAGVAALHNFPKHPQVVRSGLYRRYKGSSQLQPLFTFGNPATYAIGPGDFAKIYNIPAGATGAGQSIAVIAQTNINTNDITAFRSMFGLPPYGSASATCPTAPALKVVINGTDPGILGPDSATDDEVEADLDTQWAGSVAPCANINLVVSESTLSNPTQVSQGVDLSAVYAVDNNLSPVISDSYGNCEAGLGTTGNQFYNALWQQAAAQGITVAVAAGDTGSAGCDSNASESAATFGIAVSGLASTPYNVAVGGTDFASSTTGTAPYWITTSDTINSAQQYIPETTWNDSACAATYPSPCNTVDTTNNTDLTAGAGGPSNCLASSTDSNGNVTCSKTNNLYGYAKPSFQTSLTPADSVRDIPDVSFFAGNGGAGVAYVICQSDANPSGASCNLSTPYADFLMVGGTSAATPTFAAVMALVNAQTNQRQGNANFVLYNLASKDANYTGGKCLTSTGGSSGTPVAPNSACVFNDVNEGNNAVACESGTPNCNNTSTTTNGFGVVICAASSSTTPAWQICSPSDNGSPAFQSTTKYDLATGIGSLNITNLMNAWTSSIRTATTTTLTSSSGGSPSGTAFTATVKVSPAPSSTEYVSLIALASDQTTVLGSYGPFTLTSGSATITTNLLPPTTSYIEGSYGGDTSLAASTSTPVAVGPVTGTAANNSSTVTVSFLSNNGNGWSAPTTSGQNFQYGTAGYILRITVTGSKYSSAGCSFAYPNTKPAVPCPTGSIKLFDNGNPLTDFIVNGQASNVGVLNNQGFVEDQPINVAVGKHSITATYGGDANYGATTSSNTMSITLTQAPTTTQLVSSLSSITSGQSVTLTATVATQGGGNPPTGSVTFTSSNGNTLGSATCTGTASTATTPSYCTASLAAAISSVYPPPTGEPGTPNIPRVPALLALLTIVLFALGLRWIPQTRRRAYAYAGLVAIVLMIGVVAAGCGGGGGGGGGGGSTRTITATYPGDTNYTKSSGTTTITITAAQ
ncbi:MAG TPA: protease pro-enzyme activation domain-containing protein [Verrucomicrobiae bacterium]|nr:protease pro-enzyme activation domain-containing protein [Verrucomicrobiae bacterium]